jgi:hypothetical protein
MTADLASRSCPSCGEKLHPHALMDGEDRPPPAVLFTDLLRRCDICRVGISNARTAGSETVIYEDARANVPMEVRDEFIQALRSSINVLNRPNKLIKAGCSTSEAALTWTQLAWFMKCGKSWGFPPRVQFPPWSPFHLSERRQLMPRHATASSCLHFHSVTGS